MAHKRIHVTRQDGQRANASGLLQDEFAPMSLAWQEPGMVYCWLDRDKRVLPDRVRLGWKICNVQEDFLGLGCPRESLPGYSTPDGEIHFGASILGKMPAARLSAIRMRTEDKIRNRYKSYVNTAMDAGEQAARAIGAAAKGRSLVFPVTRDEESRDYHNDYQVRTRTGATIR